MSARLFAYGTLQLPELAQAITGKSFAAEDAVLDDYACFAVRDQAYPGAVESPGDRVPGRLYAGVDTESLSRLDRFEGVLYERRRLDVRGSGGSAVCAWVYVVPSERRAALSDEPWDVRDLATGAWRQLLG